MQALIQRLLGFDRLLGPTLVKLVFYFGAVVIAVMVCVGVVVGLLAIVAGNLGSGAMQLLAAPAVGAVAFVYWRFLCELFILAFLNYERLGEVRDLMRIAAGQPQANPNHPEF